MKPGRPPNVTLNDAIAKAASERRAADPARSAHSIAQEVAACMAEAHGLPGMRMGFSTAADVKRVLRIMKRSSVESTA